MKQYNFIYYLLLKVVSSEKSPNSLGGALAQFHNYIVLFVFLFTLAILILALSTGISFIWTFCPFGWTYHQFCHSFPYIAAVLSTAVSEKSNCDLYHLHQRFYLNWRADDNTEIVSSYPEVISNINQSEMIQDSWKLLMHNTLGHRFNLNLFKLVKFIL